MKCNRGQDDEIQRKIRCESIGYGFVVQLFCASLSCSKMTGDAMIIVVFLRGLGFFNNKNGISDALKQILLRVWS